MPQLLSYIGSAIVVGHHIAFDIALLNQQLQNLGQEDHEQNPRHGYALQATRQSHATPIIAS